MSENKFKSVMNQLFPNTNQDFTFNNFDKYIDKDSELDKKGIYVVKVKKNTNISIVEDLDFPEGPKKYEKYNKKKKIKEIKNLKDFRSYNKSREEFLSKLEKTDNEVLEIGKTDDTLKERLTKYKNFGYGKYGDTYGNEITNVSHRGGKRIWFIKDNKNNLVIDYISIDKLKDTDIYKKFKETYPGINIEANIAEYIEAGLIFLHSLYYKSTKYPFANERFECKDIKDNWIDFWENKYFC